MPHWSIWRFLSDDGQYLVKCYEGPVRLRLRPDEVMVSIYKRGSLTAVVRIDQIVAALGQTGPLADESHPWDLCRGFTSLHAFSLETEDHRSLECDVTTGALTVGEEPRKRPPGEASVEQTATGPRSVTEQSVPSDPKQRRSSDRPR
jgi:hypothetical protein